MKHNQQEDALKQTEKATSNQKQATKGQENDKNGQQGHDKNGQQGTDKMGQQHVPAGRSHSSQDDQQGKHGTKKHADPAKSK